MKYTSIHLGNYVHDIHSQWISGQPNLECYSIHKHFPLIASGRRHFWALQEVESLGVRVGGTVTVDGAQWWAFPFPFPKSVSSFISISFSIFHFRLFHMPLGTHSIGLVQKLLYPPQSFTTEVKCQGDRDL